MYQIAVENQFDFLSLEYATLHRASWTTAFQHPKWLSALYGQLLAQNAATPLVVVVRRTSDRSLVMVLPLIRRRYGMLKVVEFADLRVSDYAAVVADRHEAKALLDDEGIRSEFKRLLKPYDVLRIGKVPDDESRLGRLFGIDKPQRRQTNSYAVTLSSSFEDWRTQYLNPSFAKELAKKKRQLERKGEVRFETVMEPVALAETFEALRIFRRDRFEVNGGGELLQIPSYFQFYHSIGADPDLARVYRMTLNGETIAAALGLVHQRSLLVILSGFTQTAHRKQSPGSLLFEFIVRDCIARGDTQLDFTIGDEPYKLAFGATPSPIWQISRAGSLLGRTALVIIDRLPAARALARSLFHHRAAAVLVAPEHDVTHDKPASA